MAEGMSKAWDCLILPPELERRIFEIAVAEHPRCACSLMLVAWRTHHWYVNRSFIIFRLVLPLIGLLPPYTPLQTN